MANDRNATTPIILLAARSLSPSCCFYKAVDVGSVAEANILNMTYPLFVALFSWFMLRHQRDVVALGIVALASIGIWLILAPGMSGIQGQSWWGLLSGIFAGFIIYLNLSRQYHDSRQASSSCSDREHC